MKFIVFNGSPASAKNSISEETEAGLQKELTSIPEYVRYMGM